MTGNRGHGTNDKDRAAYAARKIAEAIRDAVREAGEQGAPESSIYLALSEQGCTPEQYQAIIGAMIELDMLRRKGNCLYAS